MYGKDIAFLLDLMNKQGEKERNSFKKSLAKKLDINLKTINSWVSNPSKMTYKIGRPYVAYMRRIFESLLILDRLRALEDKIFKIAPSEIVSFWLVCGTEVILLKDSTRNELLKPVKKFKYHNNEVHKRLSDISVTIDSIQTARVINLSGDGIKNHKKKVIHHIMTSHLSNGICYSILKIPLIIGSLIGARVVGLIDLQNKLEKVSGGKWQPIHSDEINQKALYTNEEVDLIRDVALKEYNSNLKEIIEALDYLEPDTSAHYTID